MDDERREARRDLVALLSVLIFVLGCGLGLMLFVFFTIGPSLFGPFDQPVTDVSLLLLFLLIAIGCLIVGGLIGGVLWVAAMGSILPRETMIKWLYYGPQMPPLTEFCVRVLDLVSAQKR